jgi:hypothetical protein
MCTGVDPLPYLIEGLVASPGTLFMDLYLIRRGEDVCGNDSVAFLTASFSSRSPHSSKHPLKGAGGFSAGLAPPYGPVAIRNTMASSFRFTR